jgi:hypothetical protein
MDTDMPTQMENETPAQTEDAGYCVELCVNADGTFAVSGPEPLPDEHAEGAAESAGEPLANIGQALKAILQIVQDHPLGQSQQKSFEAGYASGPARA